jgi:hypothetical protein
MHFTATRLIALAAALITLALLIYAAQPWGGNYAYQSPSGYLMLLGFAMWVTLPYLMTILLAHKASASQAKNFVAIIGGLIISLGGVALYIDAVLLHRDAQAGLAFVAVPFYQWIILGFLTGFHFLLRKKTIFMTATPASLVCKRTENVHIIHQEVDMTFRSMMLAGLAMLITVSFSLSVFATNKDTKVVPEKSPAQAIADFGVSDIEVQSVKTLDTDKLNAKVRKVAGKGKKWTEDAVLVALEFVGAGLKGSTKIIDVRTPPELAG